jgi:hypothetical protein
MGGGCPSTPPCAILRKMLAALRLSSNLCLTIIGDEKFDLGRGVAQGNILSPLLFNLVLEEALKSSRVIRNFISKGDLRSTRTCKI